jgi:aspartyl-tRNA(Asn)/glutamyl-tRNA(Gln) amidotransferase subunit B
VLFNSDTGETRAMRSKEDAHDYRYFPDPDLPPLVVSADWMARVKANLPKLPTQLRAEFVALGLSSYDAAVLTQSKAVCDYYQAVVQASGQAKLAANWVMGDVSAALNREAIDIEQAPVSAAQLGLLIKRIADSTISNNIAKTLFTQLWATPSADAAVVDRLIESQGLKQITDTGAIEAMIDGVLAANASIVAEYKGGKLAAFNSLVGQCMKAAKGKASPAVVNEILKQKLG